jgi:hypothetical protein
MWGRVWLLSGVSGGGDRVRTGWGQVLLGPLESLLDKVSSPDCWEATRPSYFALPPEGKRKDKRETEDYYPD